jgi:hypothetical protein
MDLVKSKERTLGSNSKDNTNPNLTLENAISLPRPRQCISPQAWLRP